MKIKNLKRQNKIEHENRFVCSQAKVLSKKKIKIEIELPVLDVLFVKMVAAGFDNDIGVVIDYAINKSFDELLHHDDKLPF